MSQVVCTRDLILSGSHEQSHRGQEQEQTKTQCHGKLKITKERIDYAHLIAYVSHTAFHLQSGLQSVKH